MYMTHPYDCGTIFYLKSVIEMYGEMLPSSDLAKSDHIPQFCGSAGIPWYASIQSLVLLQKKVCLPFPDTREM